LKPSDLLVLYTDGVTDANNGTGEDVGREQLLEWARHAPVESSRMLGEGSAKNGACVPPSRSLGMST
jgi:hypothetical protein